MDVRMEERIMKKFYTIIGQQYLEGGKYKDRDLILDCIFPITAHILSVIKKKEIFEVVVVDSFNTEESRLNVNLLRKELEMYFDKDFEFHYVNVDFGHEQKTQIQTFMRLYETFKENDEVYFDITFGLKPIPMTVFVSCNYAQRFIPGLKVCDVVYAHYEYGKDKDYVHPIVDVTSLFLLNNLIETISRFEKKNPMDFLKNVFELENEH